MRSSLARQGDAPELRHREKPQPSDAGTERRRFARALTLVAMSLGYGVVQLDVTIVNTALSSIGAALGAALVGPAILVGR